MNPRSAKRGARTSAPEVTNVSPHGFWLLIDGHERFVDFALFPWFRAASIGAIFNVKRPAPGHLHWPELDVDLELDSLARPADYPLVSRRPPTTVRERTPARRARATAAAPAGVANGKAPRTKRAGRKPAR